MPSAARPDDPGLRVAVLVPCRNEEQTVGEVVKSFQAALPGCVVVVADNASTDSTAAKALSAGAQVLHESRPGKGFAIRRLFADIDADVYVMVDGDATYEAAAAPRLVELVLAGADMVVGTRVAEEEDRAAYRSGHRLGNAMLTWIFQRLFRLEVTDTLSGYRAFSRRFVKTFPGAPTGFDIEAELNAHAAVLQIPTAEVPTRYGSRPHGSESKLSTYKDGWHILRRNLRLFRDAEPTLSFSILALPWLAISALLIPKAVLDYIHTGRVAHFPSLIAGVGCFLVALNLWAAGLVMTRVSRNRVEAVRLAYLAVPSPREHLLGTRPESAG